MYRVGEFITPTERLDAMRLGGLRKLASLGLKPSDLTGLSKEAGAPLAALAAAMKTSVLLGIPLGTIWYAVSSGLKNDSEKTREMKAQLDHYNDVIAQGKHNAEASGVKYASGELGDFGEFKGALGRGLAIGGGLAATIALIRQVAEARRQRDEKKRRESTSIDPNTVVLYVKKKAEAEAAQQQKPGNSVRVAPAVVSKELKPLSAKTRATNGQFSSLPGSSEKTAQAGVIGRTGQIIGAGVGLAGGFYVVSKIAQKLEQNRLKKQIEAAQTEYINLLDGNSVKNAEAFSQLFLFNDSDIQATEAEVSGGLSKSAGWPTDVYRLIKAVPESAKNISAGTLTAYLLGVGTSAYVVKRLLENQFDQEKQEKPKPQTKILFKAGESTFEIQPDQMLATVAILRDCMRDSTPAGVKIAGYDYSFLDTLDKTPEGRQWLIDQYARQQGLERGPASTPPGVSKFWNSHTLGAIQKDPAAHADAIKERVMQMAQKDPSGWFDLLGQERNQDLVRRMSENQIADMGKNNGFLGFLYKIPYVGDWIRKAMGWYTNNTQAGRRMVAGNILGQFGVTGDKAKGVLDSYDFSNPGWTRYSPGQGVATAAPPAPAVRSEQPAQAAAPAPAPAPAPAQPQPPAPVPEQPATKAAQDLSSIVAMMSRSKNLSDSTNKEILAELAKLTGKRKGPKKKPVVVEFDDEVKKLIPEKVLAQIKGRMEANG